MNLTNLLSINLREIIKKAYISDSLSRLMFSFHSLKVTIVNQ